MKNRKSDYFKTKKLSNSALMFWSISAVLIFAGIQSVFDYL